MGRATALEFVMDGIAHATTSHLPHAVAVEGPDLLTTDIGDLADANWESAWIDLGGEG